MYTSITKRAKEDDADTTSMMDDATQERRREGTEVSEHGQSESGEDVREGEMEALTRR